MRLYKVFPSAKVARRTEFEPTSMAEIIICVLRKVISLLEQEIQKSLFGLQIIKVVLFVLQ